MGSAGSSEKDCVLTADLHTHLNEKKTNPKKYWLAAEKSSLDAIAITEHIEYDPKSAFEKLEETKPKGILLIPGMEMFTSHGHVLAYGETNEIYDVEELRKKGISMEDAHKAAKKNKVVLSFAHPWGYDHDSVVYRAGINELRKYSKKKGVGVEAYNGMIGELAESVLKSGWVRKPLNLFGALERNRFARGTGVGKIFENLKKKADKRAVDLVYRSSNAAEFGEEACFVTAGSDAHSAERIGCGIIKLRSRQKNPDEKSFLRTLQDKSNVLWTGPFFTEKGNSIEKKKMGVTKKEVFSGLKYITKRRKPEEKK